MCAFRRPRLVKVGPRPALVLRGLRGKSRRSLRRNGHLSRYLVLRELPEDSAHSQKESSTLGLELVLRQIPGKSVQWPGHLPRPHRLPGLHLGRPHLDPPRLVVVRVPRPPRRLRRCAPGRLARLPRAALLPTTHPSVWREPPPALPTRTLPSHGPASSPPRLAPPPSRPASARRQTADVHRASGWTIPAEQGRVNSRER